MLKSLIVLVMLVPAMAQCNTSKDQSNTDKDALELLPFPVVSALLEHDKKPIISLNWSPDGSKLATTTSDEISRIWTRGSDGSYAEESRRVSRSVHLREWEDDSSFLSMVMDLNKKPFAFDIDTFSFCSWNPHSASGYSNVYARSWCTDNTIKCYYGKETSCSLYGHTSDVLFTAWSHDCTKLASGARDGMVVIWYLINQARLSAAQLAVLNSVAKASGSYHSKVKGSAAQELRDGVDTAFPTTNDPKMALIKIGLERQLDGIIAQGSPVADQ